MIGSNTSEVANEKMNIMLPCTDNYVPYACVLINSLRKNNPLQDIEIYFVTEFFEDGTIKILDDYLASLSIEYHVLYVSEEIYGSFKDFNVKNRNFPRILFCPLVAHYILPSTVNRIMLLEIDTIVDGDLSQLYFVDMDRDNSLFAGVTWGRPYKQYRRAKQYLLEDGISVDRSLVRERHINAGLILVNVAKMREEGITIDFFKEYMQYHTVENILCEAFGKKDRITYVDPSKYNYRVNWKKKIFSLGMNPDPIIIHYVNTKIDALYLKPWQILFDDADLHYISPGSYVESELNPLIHESFKLWWSYVPGTPYADQLFDTMRKEKEIFYRFYPKLLIQKDVLIQSRFETVDTIILGSTGDYQKAYNICCSINNAHSNARIIILYLLGYSNDIIDFKLPRITEKISEIVVKYYLKNQSIRPDLFNSSFIEMCELIGIGIIAV